MPVWIVEGRVNRVFKNRAASENWIKENDKEAVAFEYDVFE